MSISNFLNLIILINRDLDHIYYGCLLKNKNYLKKNYLKRFIVMFSPEAIIIYFFRMSRFFYLSKLEIISIFIKNLILFLYNCDLSYKAEIEGGIRFFHPFGIVIPDFCKIGKFTAIFSNVTIGNKYPYLNDSKKIIIGNKCILSTGSVLLSGCFLPDNFMVGANIVISEDLRVKTIKGCKKLTYLERD